MTTVQSWNAYITARIAGAKTLEERFRLIHLYEEEDHGRATEEAETGAQGTA